MKRRRAGCGRLRAAIVRQTIGRVPRIGGGGTGSIDGADRGAREKQEGQKDTMMAATVESLKAPVRVSSVRRGEARV